MLIYIPKSDVNEPEAGHKHTLLMLSKHILAITVQKINVCSKYIKKYTIYVKFCTGVLLLTFICKLSVMLMNSDIIDINIT